MSILDPADFMTEDGKFMYITRDNNYLLHNIEDMKKFVEESLYVKFVKVLCELYEEVESFTDDEHQNSYIAVSISRICETCADDRIDRETVISMLMCIIAY